MVCKVIGAALLLEQRFMVVEVFCIIASFQTPSISLASLLRGLWLSACFWPRLHNALALSPWTTMLMHSNIISPCLLSELYATLWRILSKYHAVHCVLLTWLSRVAAFFFWVYRTSCCLKVAFVQRGSFLLSSFSWLTGDKWEWLFTTGSLVLSAVFSAVLSAVLRLALAGTVTGIPFTYRHYAKESLTAGME